MLLRHSSLGFAAAALLWTSAPALEASGFARDRAARAAGRAGSGFAQADAPSSFALNPAAAAFLKYRQFEIGGRAAVPFLSFDGEDPFPGPTGTESMSKAPAVAPALYYTHAVTERLVLGLGVDEPFSFEQRWSEPSFSGRFLSRRSSLHSLSVMPVLGYRLADRLAVGAYLDVRRTSFQLDRHVAAIQPFTQEAVDAASLTTGRASGTKVSGAFGLLARPSDAFSIGLSYRHEVSAELSGQATLSMIPTGNAQVDARFATMFPGSVPYVARINLPARAGVGLAYELDTWTVTADVEWSDWSSFGGGPIAVEARPDLAPELAGEWRDVFSFRIGVERPVNESWTVRGGYAFGESPVVRESLNPFAPELRRHVGAIGATWTSGAWRLDLANSVAVQPGRSTSGTSRLLYDGRYKGLVNTFSVSFGYQY